MAEILLKVFKVGREDLYYSLGIVLLQNIFILQIENSISITFSFLAKLYFKTMQCI